MAAHAVLAALSWDPQIRGAAIVLTAIAILPGSVYLLLATNMGARVGLLLALTGLTGWMTVMALVWMVFGIGLKGAEPVWKVQDVVTGNVEQSTVDVVAGFPKGWAKLQQGDAELADAEAAAERVLASGSAQEGGGSEGGGGGGGEEGQKFSSPFKSSEDYEAVGGYRKGGETYFLTLRHRPHYAVYQVKPKGAADATAGATPQSSSAPGGGGATPQPAPGQPPSAVTPSPGAESPSGAAPPPGTQAPAATGPSTQVAGSAQAAPAPGPPPAPLTTVIMVRDLGNLRFPPFLVMLSAATMFGVCTSTLHRRDKEIMRARAEAAT